MEPLTYQIKKPKNLTFEQIVNNRAEGGKFIFFQYLIPIPLFAPIKRISKIYYVKAGERPSQYNAKYNLITLFWGWWGLPFGPSYTYSTVRDNKTGFDISEDVYDNLTKEDFENGKVTIKKISSLFIHPDKSSLKELKKCFIKYGKNYAAFAQSPVIGYYIDTDEPQYFVGLDKTDLDKTASLDKAIHKYFYNYIKFEYVDIDELSELPEKLKKQGFKIC